MENKVIAKEYVRNIITEKIKWLDKQTMKGKYYFENVKLANDILEELLEKIK
jgi:DNA recombination-dependent growth factor C